MAASRRRPLSLAPAAEDSRKALPRLADHTDAATPSPALRQRDLLGSRWPASDAEPQDPGRWSQRKTLAFIGLTCGGFWTCIAVGAAQLLR